LWNDRAALATFGIVVNGDCATSANSVFTATIVPALAATFTATGATQNLSCTDIPGTADGILTPSDITTLDGAVTAMNAQIQQIAQANGWAFADLSSVFPPAVSGRTPYSSSDQLTCVYPYGASVSLDGVFPNDEGQLEIATVVSGAIKAKYGFGTALDDVLPQIFLRAKLCP
jgi:hypothetical protein